jgi:SAM-dependent methyltransferase
MGQRHRGTLGGYEIAYEPELLPPPHLMRQEGIDVLEEWFRWGEEWSVLLRCYGLLTRKAAVLEIGCGLGRTAFPLRYIVRPPGSYDGFEICRYKVEFLERTFHPRYPQFRFIWADIHNTYYNPGGQILSTEYHFPYADASFDLIYAASVFTHLLPESAAHYVRESGRVLRPGGRCVFSLFLLDHYRPGQTRPSGFDRPMFDFDHAYGGYGDEFAVGVPSNPEEMTAYRLRMIERFAADAGLSLERAPLPGFWSGGFEAWFCAQDLVVLVK